MKSLPLTPDVLVAAYANGIFPMDVDGTIQWFSPDPRAIIPLEAFHASKTLRQTYRSGTFEVRLDSAFEEVIRVCAERPELHRRPSGPHRDEAGRPVRRRARGMTWISPEIVAAYSRLHKLGLAHSVESWRNDELAGGLYGVTLGGAFFGESMFHRQADASKVALVALVERMRDRGFALLDVQFLTPHLQRFGATEIPRWDYLRRLKHALAIKTTFVD